ncbi:glycosyltransferase family 2 protein [Micrococcus sp. ACRRV]|uniref:glycosyltransferase n=1 Tax=Micrococcus sp. ACRRV TaxID=2918203 RepID=UPI001EF34B54|nr:glycosyltransferase family 2 protein [Micrococcus sp. ACRRV]
MSVIIPCYNGADHVLSQIKAVTVQLSPADEVIVVDNRSTDGTRNVLESAAAADPRIRVVPAMGKAGANYARNMGIAAASGDLLLFCDADDVVSSGWVDAFSRALADHGVAGGRATPVDEAGRPVGPDLELHEIFGGPPYPIGANMAIRRSVVAAVGGFDESFIGGHDEVDFAWRASAAGWPTVFAHDAHIEYLQRPTVKAAVRQRRSYARTAVQLWARHPETVDPHGVSFTGAVQNLAKNAPRGFKVTLGRGSFDDAAAWGWNLGLVEGHLRYRILGSPPARSIPTPGQG